MVDLGCEDPAHYGAAVLEGDRRLMGDRREQRTLLVGERRVPVAHELTDLAAFPAEWKSDGVGA